MNSNLTDRQQYDTLVKDLSSEGFTVLSSNIAKHYLSKIFYAELFSQKRKKPFPEQAVLGCVCSNGKIILALTTYNHEINAFIAPGITTARIYTLDAHGEPNHRSRQIRRVGDFCSRIKDEALINKYRVEGAAFCKCRAKMRIVFRKSTLKARFFVCSDPWHHRNMVEKVPVKGFNYGLKGNYLDIVTKRTKKRSKYARARKSAQPIAPSMR